MPNTKTTKMPKTIAKRGLDYPCFRADGTMYEVPLYECRGSIDDAAAVLDLQLVDRNRRLEIEDAGAVAAVFIVFGVVHLAVRKG